MTFPAELYREFLRTAAFGSVRLGADEPSVLETAGTAHDEGTLGRSMRVLAFQSKHLQVTFKGGRVVHFGLYFRDKKRRPVVLANLELSGRTSVDDLGHWMRAAGLGWEQDVQANEIRMNCGNGIVAVFDEGSLDSLQVS